MKLFMPLILMILLLASPPAREAWIEISSGTLRSSSAVTSPPAREAWIEIRCRAHTLLCRRWSPPAREAWIEMLSVFAYHPE